MLTAGYESIVADLFPKLVEKIDDSDGLDSWGQAPRLSLKGQV